MVRQRSSVVVPTDAPSPQSVAAFQRAAHRPIKYRVRIRWSDGLDGIRDGRAFRSHTVVDRVAGSQQTVAYTAWLDRLFSEYLGSIESERLAARAAISVLGSQWVAADAAARAGRDGSASATEARATLRASALDVHPMSTGEQYDTMEQIRARRQAARQREDAALTATIDQQLRQADRADIAKADFADAISAHWGAMLIRVAALSAYYARRAGTYTRRLQGRRGATFFPPTMARPEWAETACPWAPAEALVGSGLTRMGSGDE